MQNVHGLLLGYLSILKLFIVQELLVFRDAAVVQGWHSLKEACGWTPRGYRSKRSSLPIRIIIPSLNIACSFQGWRRRRLLSCQRETETDRQTDRERERDRQRETETDRQTDRDRENVILSREKWLGMGGGWGEGADRQNNDWVFSDCLRVVDTEGRTKKI